MNRLMRSLLILLLCAAPGTALSGDPYTIDATHSNVTFGIRHIFSIVNGRFTKFKGTLQFDQNAPEKLALEMSVETGSISTDNERRDAHLRGGDFFLADSFPALTFKSTKAFRDEKGLFLEGNLTIRGVTQSVVVPFEVLGVGGEPGKMVAGFVSSFKINRKDFGITWNRAIDQGGMLLGDEVNVHIGIEAKYYLQ
jgi:polyisoprenoid-binding protein YceI